MNNSSLLFQERIDIEFQVRGSINRTFDFGEIISIGNSKDMLGIGTKKLYREVGESLIKYAINSNFTSLRFNVIPDDMSCGVRDITKEDTFSSFFFEPIYLEFCSADPNSTAKSTEILEVVFFFGQ